MARFIGSFMDDQELDRPDLNKCPDCECFFPQDTCPICGKVCPEEMRAGNRKKQKKKKSRNGRSKTTQYIDWYHQWWFIILMFFVFPLLSVILLFGSPHKKSVKIALVVLAVVYMLVSSFGIGRIFGQIGSIFEKPVDTSLSQNEYIAKCVEMSGEEYYRHADNYSDSYVKMKLNVKNTIATDKATYYLCEYVTEDWSYTIYVRDCLIKDKQNFVGGDTIIVYGECEGKEQIYSYGVVLGDGPLVNMAYAELIN